MLTHPTSERLITLGLTGMAKALDEQRRADTTFEPLGFEDRLGLLVDREAAEVAVEQAQVVEDAVGQRPGHLHGLGDDELPVFPGAVFHAREAGASVGAVVHG